jgi:purine-binding chemotaxis protein CheW
MTPQSNAVATPVARSSSSNTTSEFLTFRLANVNYAIDILKVQEIRAFESPTRLPNSPDYLKGVLNLRGVIVPVIDLRARLGLQSAAIDAATVTIILALSFGVVGAVVDSVSDVVDLPPDQIKPAPIHQATVDARCITGIATLGQDDEARMLVMLDIDGALAGADSAIAPHAIVQ